MQDVGPIQDSEIEIKQGTVKDRTISTTDPESRAGRKSSRNLFEGHKASIAVDTDTGMITEVDVIAALSEILCK